MRNESDVLGGRVAQFGVTTGGISGDGALCCLRELVQQGSMLAVSGRRVHGSIRLIRSIRTIRSNLRLSGRPVASPTMSDLTQPASAPESGFDTEDFEFIELQNTGDKAIQLSGARLTGGIELDLSSSEIQTLES